MFKLEIYDKNYGCFAGEWVETFEEVLEWTKEATRFGLMKVIDLADNSIIWSSPGGFSAQCIFTQKCKTTDESLEMLKFYDENKNLLIIKLIEKYVGIKNY